MSEGTESERQNIKIPTGTLERLNLVRWHYGLTQYAMIDEALSCILKVNSLPCPQHSTKRRNCIHAFCNSP
jgi:hypothetical protein